MNDSHVYALTVRVENYIPPDVLVEHVAVCLKSLNFTGKVDIIMAGYEAPDKITPFSDKSNVVFDDDIMPAQNGGYVSGAPTAGMLHTNETVYPKGFLPARQLNAGSIVYSQDALPADPYPLTTRVLDALRGRKRND